MEVHLLLLLIKLCVAFGATEPIGRKIDTQGNSSTFSWSNESSTSLIKAVNPLYLIALDVDKNVSSRCKTAYANFLDGVDRDELDAIKMLDATAKIPSGLLSGNVNQFGDFDECLSVEAAQYCLVELDVRHLWKEPFLKYRELVHSHFAIRDEFDDPKHRVPGFTMIKWGICLPKECEASDVKNSLEYNFGVKANVRPEMCQKSSDASESSVPKLLSVFFFLCVFGVAILSTVMDYKGLLKSNQTGKISRTLICFSVIKNWKKIVNVDTDENKSTNIRAVDGIRALSALGLLLSHKVMSLYYNPYINRTAMSESFGLSWSVIGRTAIIYTDSFLFLSGLLNANSLLNDLLNGRGLRFKDKLINRIFRIWPNVLATILFCTYILPELGNGPLWPVVINQHSELCKKHMWRNLIFVHNLFSFDKMCLTHTHQVGIDMQLFIVTPIFVLFFWLNRSFGILFLTIAAVLSTILRAWITWSMELSHMVHFGVSVSRMFATGTHSYIIPTHRATIYLMGVALAYFMKTGKTKKLSKTLLAFLWTLTVIIGFSPMFGPFHMAKIGYKYNVVDATIYGSLSPIFWGIGIAWAVYAANNNAAGWFGDFLSWKYFKIFSKIAFSFYLVQFPVFFYNVGLTRHSDEFKMKMMLEIGETLAIILLSVVLTLFVELPFHNLKAVIFDDLKVKRKIDEKSERKVKRG